MTRVCVLLAPGFEEIEAVTVIDVLRRADVEVVALGVEARRVEGAHGIVVEADDELAARGESEAWDVVVLPGGMPGSAHLRDSEPVQRLLRRQHEAGRRLAAICAAPIALARAGVLEGRRSTSYPTFRDQLGDVDYLEDRVVVDGTVTTSRAPGTALAFALGLVRELCDDDTARRLAEAMLVEGVATD